MSTAEPTDDKRSFWFHILPQTTEDARHLHAVKLVDKAWSQGDRVCLVCDSVREAEALDDLLWQYRPDAFLPHCVVTDAATHCPDRVGILLYPPAAADWDSVIILSASLPADANCFRRLALVAHNDPSVLAKARSHFRQLRALGIEPKVHDLRKRSDAPG